jgi:hypothetical protein
MGNCQNILDLTQRVSGRRTVRIFAHLSGFVLLHVYYISLLVFVSVWFSHFVRRPHFAYLFSQRHLVSIYRDSIAFGGYASKDKRQIQHLTPSLAVLLIYTMEQ